MYYFYYYSSDDSESEDAMVSLSITYKAFLFNYCKGIYHVNVYYNISNSLHLFLSFSCRVYQLDQ